MGVRSGGVVGLLSVLVVCCPWVCYGAFHALIGHYLPYDWAMSGRKSWNNYGIITG